jgi:hypothetical protein
MVDVMDPDGGLPAILLVGPRGTGKTTTAERHAASVLRLDRPSERRAVEADPDTALATSPRPLLIDEWQLVPDVLSAVKRAVDRDFAPGQFVLTGSSRADLTQSGWAGTGRLVRFALWGMTERELIGRGDDVTTFLRSACDPEAPLPDVVDPPNLRGYVERALRGGLPQLARASSPGRRALLADAYVEQLITRDIESADGRRNPNLLRRYLRTLAASTAGTPSIERLVQAASIDRATAGAYDDVLELVMVTQRVPAYASNRLSRLAHRPKRYLAEPSLLGPLIGIDERAVLRDADLLGRVIDTYVAAQIRPELELLVPRPQLFHLRDTNGEHEIDLVVELPDGSLVAIEIKASSAPTRDDARHLRWLRDHLGDRFIRGIVFHTGPRSFQFEPGIWYLPIAALWS